MSTAATAPGRLSVSNAAANRFNNDANILAGKNAKQGFSLERVNARQTIIRDLSSAQILHDGPAARLWCLEQFFILAQTSELDPVRVRATELIARSAHVDLFGEHSKPDAGIESPEAQAALLESIRLLIDPPAAAATIDVQVDIDQPAAPASSPDLGIVADNQTGSHKDRCEATDPERLAIQG